MVTYMLGKNMLTFNSAIIFCSRIAGLMQIPIWHKWLACLSTNAVPSIFFCLYIYWIVLVSDGCS